MTIRFGIMTLSDRSARGERTDASGQILVNFIQAQGWKVEQRAILPDDADSIRAMLLEWADSGKVDIILTTGGTGFASRDVTPDATRAVIQRETPGIVEAIRNSGMAKTPHSMLSRAMAGIRGSTLIINLPGSPKGVAESMDVIIPVLEHAVDLLRGDPASESAH